MIRSLRLGNFKAFAEPQDIPLRPLTLIFGPNSAGKSSIIHSLALAHHAMLTGELDTEHTRIGGDAIDLGGFRQYVHRRDATKSVEWTVELDAAQFHGRLAELVAPTSKIALQFLFGQQGGTSEVGVHVCTLLADGSPILSMSTRGKSTLRVDRLDQTNPVFREVLRAIVLTSTTTDEIHEADFGGLTEAVDSLVPDLSARLAPFLPRLEVRSTSDQELAQALLLPVSRGNRERDLVQAVKIFLPRTLRDLVDGLSGQVEAALGKLRYLGPLRSYPPRHLVFSANGDANWYAGGGHAWDVIRRNGEVRDRVNRWLGDRERLQTPYQLSLKRLIPASHTDYALLQSLDEILRKFTGKEVGDWSEFLLSFTNREEDEPGLTEYMLKSMSSAWDVDAFSEVIKAKLLDPQLVEGWNDLVLIDVRSGTVMTHRDVGIGISQVLPVLVTAFASQELLIAIEQPEIHLHPALQAELGDVFLESALGANHNTLLLETHSEHILLRVMRRMRDTVDGNLPKGAPEVHPDDVMVLYVEPDGPRSIVRQMPMNERGELVKAWPGGFFEEGLKEVF
jgi:hypothetical protein